MANEVAPNPANPDHQPARQKKKYRCPVCTAQFVTVVSYSQKIHCPSCQVRLAVRGKSSKTAPAPAAPPTKAAPSRPTRASAKRSARSKQAGSAKWLVRSLIGTVAMVLVVGAGCLIWPHDSVDVEQGEWVQGIVSCEGKPLAAGLVLMQGEDRVVRTAPICADGTYALPMVPHGKVRVAVVNWNPTCDLAQPKSDDGIDGGTAVPAASQPTQTDATDLDRSGIEVMVAGATDFDIELK